MAIFNSYVKLPEGTVHESWVISIALEITSSHLGHDMGLPNYRYPVGNLDKNQPLVGLDKAPNPTKISDISEPDYIQIHMLNTGWISISLVVKSVFFLLKNPLMLLASISIMNFPDQSPYFPSFFPCVFTILPGSMVIFRHFFPGQHGSTGQILLSSAMLRPSAGAPEEVGRDEEGGREGPKNPGLLATKRVGFCAVGFVGYL